MAKIKNFKQLTGKFTVTVDGRKFTCNNSKLPLYTQVVNMFGKKRHPTACIGIQRHKDVAKSAKLCGMVDCACSVPSWPFSPSPPWPSAQSRPTGPRRRENTPANTRTPNGKAREKRTPM